jgi:DNA-binding NtrC family response regulator
MSNFMVLLVEDDILQRAALADFLRSEGLEVIECGSAEAAELVIATSGAELRLVVTDNQLNGDMTGVQLIEYARERFPHLNLVVTSSKSVDHLPTGTHFLQKPFTVRELLELI